MTPFAGLIYTETNRMKRIAWTSIVLALTIIIASFIEGHFISPYNIKNILRWTGLFGILSIGVSFVIMTGGIDLSIGSIVGLIGGLAAHFLTIHGYSIGLTFVICIGMGVFMGYLHGFFITRINVQPFVVTLCGLFIYRGLGRFILKDVTQGYGHSFSELKFLASGRIPSAFWVHSQPPKWIADWSLPLPFIILLTIAVILGCFLKYSTYGRYILAIGSNENAVEFSGVNTNRVKILAYIISATCSSFAGILFSLDLNTVQPSTAGDMYELYAIAGCVVGGVSLKGGEGSILGVIIGTAIVRVLYNAINILGIAVTLEFTVIGLVILLGASVDEIVKNITKRHQVEETIQNERDPNGERLVRSIIRMPVSLFLRWEILSKIHSRHRQDSRH